MERKWSYDQIVGERQEKKYRAYARSPEEVDEIDKWLEGLKSLEKIELEINEAARTQREEVRKLLEILYRDRVLPFEKYDVLYKAKIDKMSREQIREKTGKSAGALRKTIHDAKETLKRKGLWDKFCVQPC